MSNAYKFNNFIQKYFVSDIKISINSCILLLMNNFDSPEQKEHSVNSPYARKSFRNFVIAFLLLAIQLFSVTILINGGIVGVLIILIPILACFILAILGLIYGIKSTRKKESSRWLKYIGLVGNMMLTSTLFTMLVYFLFSYFA